MLVAVIASPSIEGMARDIQKAKPYADCFEFRLDCLEKLNFPEIEALKTRTTGPVIFTLRRRDQGGFFKGGELDRLEELKALAKLRPDYLDIEYDVEEGFKQKIKAAFPTLKLISSYHDFINTPLDLDTLLGKVKSPSSDIVKIITTARSGLDALRVVNFVKTHAGKQSLTSHAMGADGEPSRILGAAMGNYFTYASLEDEIPKTLGPSLGSLSLKVMVEQYRVKDLTLKTDIYALLGDPVDKSAGPQFHNKRFQEAGRDALYTRFRLDKNDLQTFFKESAILPFKGFSVTRPHKEEVLKVLTKKDENLIRIGALNTLKIDGKKISGFNTDGKAVLDLLEKTSPVKGKTLLLLGAGGTAKAIAHEAKERGLDVTIMNRSTKRAKDLALKVGAKVFGLEDFKGLPKGRFDFLINTLPKEADIDFETLLSTALSKGGANLDANYGPTETPCIALAKTLGFCTFTGWEMFKKQAQLQQNHWCASIAPSLEKNNYNEF